MTKECRKCGIEKDISEFRNIKRKTKISKYSYCRKCENKTQRDHYRKNPDPYTKRSKSWKSKNIAKFEEYQKSWRKNNKLKCVQKYGGKCACCGEKEMVFLNIDHVNGGGNIHRKNVVKNGAVYRWLIKNNFPEGFQVLCWNCNLAKHILGTCPHKPIRRIRTRV